MGREEEERKSQETKWNGVSCSQSRGTRTLLGSKDRSSSTVLSTNGKEKKKRTNERNKKIQNERIEERKKKMETMRGRDGDARRWSVRRSGSARVACTRVCRCIIHKKEKKIYRETDVVRETSKRSTKIIRGSTSNVVGRYSINFRVHTWYYRGL